VKRVQRRIFGSKEGSNKMEDIAAYSEQYYLEILGVPVYQIPLGWLNKKKTLHQKLNYVSLQCKLFQFGGRKYLR
jgi:hypothetical protein